MDRSHRRILRVVHQSATSTTCELPARSGLCCAGSCGGCSWLTSGASRSTAQTPGIELPSALVRAPGDSIRVGDSIELEAPAGMLLALSLVFYLVPAILMLFFAVSCSFLYPESEALTAVAAFGGLSIGLGAIIICGPALRSCVTNQLTVRCRP